MGTILQMSIFCYYLATQAGKAPVPVKGGVEITEGKTQKGCTLTCKSLAKAKLSIDHKGLGDTAVVEI